MFKKIASVNWVRRLCQIASTALLGEFAFYGIFRCPFAVPYVGCTHCPVVQCPGRKWWIPVWIGILASALVFGRAFCGWACPAGFLADLLGKAALLKGRLKGMADKALSAGKYPVLAASLIVFFALNNPRWAVPIRTGDFFGSVKLTFEHADAWWLWRAAVVLAAIGLGVVVSHLWCRYLCPTGGLLEIFNRFAPLKYRMTASCDNCDKCREACPVESRPAETNCNNCGACAAVCPVDAVQFGTRPKARHESRDA